MIAIYKRELNALFNSMIGYIIITFLLAFTGIYFLAYNLNYGYPYFAYVLSGITFLYLIIVPILTMRSFAEERKSKTDQLLLTSPVSLFQVVMGKYLAMITIIGIPCVVYLFFPWIIKLQGTAYIAVDYLTILIFFLLGCTYIALGMFVSSLTESPVISAVGSFGILMVLYLWSGIVGFLPTSALLNMLGVFLVITVLVGMVFKMTENWTLCGLIELIGVIACVIVYVLKKDIYESLLANICGKLDLTAPFNDICSNQLFNVNGVILYLSLIALFIFLTMEMIQKRRWS